LSAKTESRVMETNDTWWKYAWRLTITNTGSTPRTVAPTVEFQDADGFPVDSARGEITTIAPGGEQTITGSALITASVAGRVAKLNAKLAMR